MGPIIMTLKCLRLSSAGEALIPGAATSHKPHAIRQPSLLQAAHINYVRSIPVGYTAGRTRVAKQPLRLLRVTTSAPPPLSTQHHG